MEVIPELKNTKSLSMEVQKEKEGELILKALQPGDVVVLLDDSSYIVLFYGSSYDEQGCFHTSTILIIAQK